MHSSLLYTVLSLSIVTLLCGVANANTDYVMYEGAGAFGNMSNLSSGWSVAYSYEYPPDKTFDETDREGDAIVYDDNASA